MIALAGRCIATNDADSTQALTRMVAEYQGSLLRMCYLYLQDAAAAQDAVQETVLNSFQGKSTERTWLTVIAINTWNAICQG